MATILFYCLASVLLVGVHSKSLERITNGHTADEGQFPYIVQLYSQVWNGTFSCAGSIISNTWILTAAHCTEGVLSVDIYYGSTQREQGEFVAHVKADGNIITHPEYYDYNDSLCFNDISLIRTPEVKFNDLIQPISLPSSDQRNETFGGKWATASGWGMLSNKKGDVPDQLQWVDLQITENSKCGDYYGGFPFPKGVLCVATPNKQSLCNGDSGGPLVLHSKNILVGVHSLGPKLCALGKVAFYTRVSEYLDWIREVSGVSS